MSDRNLEITSNQLKSKLLNHLTAELLDPLTTILGMASVLGEEIYGSLNTKQKEYLAIINQEAHQLQHLIEKISALAQVDEMQHQLDRKALDIGNLCLQVARMLEPIAKKRNMEIKLTVGPSDRIWLLDKMIMEQMIHNLLFSVIHASHEGSQVKIHVTRKQEGLNIIIWVAHELFDENIPHLPMYAHLLEEKLQALEVANSRKSHNRLIKREVVQPRLELSFAELGKIISEKLFKNEGQADDYQPIELLSLLLSCQLVELHGGTFCVQGFPETGYRYVLALPFISSVGILNY